MRRVKIELLNIFSEIEKFYNYKEWHFITVNGVDLGNGELEIGWIFSKYERTDEIVLFYTQTNYAAKIPSITSLVPSAIMSERELVDLFGVDVEGAKKGLYLDDDSPSMPLGSCKV